jgi:CheY-like chemotaxis protein
MTKPLALILYERLLPGSQLVNRLQDLGYRVHALSEGRGLVPQALQEKPLIVFVDLASTRTDVPAAIRALKTNPETRHIPVIAIADLKEPALAAAASAAGAKLVAGSDGVLDQLRLLLDQALVVY